MPTIVMALGRKRIEEISEKNGLNHEEKDMLLKILHGWDRVVDKRDKIKILDDYIGDRQKKECEKIVNALIQIDKEYREKIMRSETKRKIRDDIALHVKG